MADFIELSKYCINRYKESLNTEYEVYLNTLYIAIDEEGEVICSSTPHILGEAYKCILIHSCKRLEVTNWYRWYKLEYLDHNGCVTDGILGDGFKLSINFQGSYSNQKLYLHHENLAIYSCPAPFEDKIKKIWNLYLRAKKAKSKAAIELVAELIEKDETILENEDEIKNLSLTNILLEKQNKKYRGLLRNIEEMVNKLNG